MFKITPEHQWRVGRLIDFFAQGAMLFSPERGPLALAISTYLKVPYIIINKLFNTSASFFILEENVAPERRWFVGPLP